MTSPIFLIAEIGVNHQNDIDLARVMIRMAKEGGADAAKFQYSTVDEEVSARLAPEHHAELRGLVPSLEFITQCAAICEEFDIEFLCTPSGPRSLEAVLKLGQKRIKVASDNLTNEPFLMEVRGANLPVILSTGMAQDLNEVMLATQFISRDDTTVMQCTSAYPCPDSEAHVSVLAAYRRVLRARLGFSDHTEGEVAAILAAAYGATVFEKHITIDRRLPGPDHRASMLANQLWRYRHNLMEALVLRGDSTKRRQPSEDYQRFGKSLVAEVDIKKGERFTPKNVAIKRPGAGVAPREYFNFIHHGVADRDYLAGEALAPMRRSA